MDHFTLNLSKSEPSPDLTVLKPYLADLTQPTKVTNVIIEYLEVPLTLFKLKVTLSLREKKKRGGFLVVCLWHCSYYWMFLSGHTLLLNCLMVDPFINSKIQHLFQSVQTTQYSKTETHWYRRFETYKQEVNRHVQTHFWLRRHASDNIWLILHIICLWGGDPITLIDSLNAWPYIFIRLALTVSPRKELIIGWWRWLFVWFNTLFQFINGLHTQTACKKNHH